jgi:hypothetical protein
MRIEYYQARQNDIVPFALHIISHAQRAGLLFKLEKDPFLSDYMTASLRSFPARNFGLMDALI